MHAVCETAHAQIDGYLCRLTDGIRRERVNGCVVCIFLHNIRVSRRKAFCTILDMFTVLKKCLEII